MVQEIVALFGDAPGGPKVIDRRESPVNGYRAVHVVVFLESVPVEIQVRTRLQHEWAELFEKLADIVGRDVRDGEPPVSLLSLINGSRPMPRCSSYPGPATRSPSR